MLTFSFSLEKADILIKDKEGHPIVEEPQTLIYEGKEIFISDAEDYPYTITITSPLVQMEGEIVLEEE